MLNKIAISGGIACGKSTFLTILASLVGEDNVVSCDDIVARLYTDASVQHEILLLMKEYQPNISEFSKENIKRLMHIPAFKKSLEGYVHPLVRQNVESSKALFVEVPLLFETGTHTHYYESWVVACEPDIQIQRLMSRNNISRLEAQRWIDMQMPLCKKIIKADRVFFNNQTDVRSLKIDLWGTLYILEESWGRRLLLPKQKLTDIVNHPIQ